MRQAQDEVGDACSVDTGSAWSGGASAARLPGQGEEAAESISGRVRLSRRRPEVDGRWADG